MKVVEDEPDNKAELLANIEEKFREYQRSLWDLQRAIPGGTPGMPPGLYPSLSHLQLVNQGEGDPRLTWETSASHQDVSKIQDLSQGSVIA